MPHEITPRDVLQHVLDKNQWPFFFFNCLEGMHLRILARGWKRVMWDSPYLTDPSH